jgi:plastocyanin
VLHRRLRGAAHSGSPLIQTGLPRVTKPMTKLSAFRRPVLAASQLAAIAVLATACGGNTPRSTPSSSVSIRDYAFVPATIVVTPGTKITFTNDDKTAHTATTVSTGFDTGTIMPGKRVTVTLQKPGSYAYVCQFHAFMRGTVIVRR